MDDISFVSEDGFRNEGDNVKLKNGSKKSKANSIRSVSFFRLLSYADSIDVVLMVLGTIGGLGHGLAHPGGYLFLGMALHAFGTHQNDTHATVKALYKILPYVWYLAACMLPAGFLEVACWIYTSERQSARLRLHFMKAILNQEISYYDTDVNIGKVISNITDHIDLIQDAIGEKVGHFIFSVSTFVIGAIIAFAMCWQVALVTILVVPLIAIIGATYSKTMVSNFQRTQLNSSEATSIIQETISQIRTVFAFIGEKTAYESFTKVLEKQMKLSKIGALAKGLGIGVLNATTNLSWALMIWIGALVVTHGYSNGARVITAVMCILFGGLSLTFAAPDLQAFSQGKAAGYEVFEIMERKSKISYEQGGKTLEKLEGCIDIHNVRFSYPSRPQKIILRSFSLSVPAGKTVALVGNSGCGKSTVISLLQRFYDPLKGKVLIDGIDIKELDLRFLRRNVGLVAQEPCLFATSIRDNIRMGKWDASIDMIERAADQANAHSFISGLPDKYETQVGDRGMQLSGGQKQRIAIARAILKNPCILLLDEATSALDSQSERNVQEALDNIMSNRTTLVIAHRLSTIVNADLIAVIEQGKVTELGNHTQLLKKSKLYSEMISLQNLTSGKAAANDENRLEKGTQSNLTKENDHVIKSPMNPNMENSASLTDSTITFADKVKGPENLGQLSILRFLFKMNAWEVGKIVAGSVAAATTGISKPLFGFSIMTIGVTYYKPHALEKVETYSEIFVGIGALVIVAHTVQHFFFGEVGERAMKTMRETLFSGILGKEISWFDKAENSSSLVSGRIMNDTVLVKSIIADRMSVIVQCISSILIATVVSMIVNWRMALVAWAVMPCHLVGGLIQAWSSKGFATDSATAHAEISRLGSEAVINIRTVASFVYEDQIIESVKNCLRRPLKKSRRESLKYGLIQGIAVLLWNVAHAVALLYTTILLEKHQATFKNSVRAYQLFSLTVPSITELWTTIPAVFRAMKVLSPIMNVLRTNRQIDGDMQFESIKGHIEFKNVSFCYPSRPEVPILRNFSISVKSGTTLALVGASGAGKSSIIALIERFYDPQHGEILIDGRDTKMYNLKWLRKYIGLVQQEPLLFSTSIKENILYGNEGASEYEIMAAAEEANVHTFVSSLPNGYNTLVGDKGSQLSGGQKQRIAIARIILKRPSILLLDEATSALDVESEVLIVAALDKLYNSCKCTRVVVAHRLSTVVNSDVIAVMEKGQVMEMGSHSDMVSKGGLYTQMLTLQKITTNEVEE
ncbi:ABC transporter B family member 19-like [Cryptomeria japonica]|uniref:ABC transporter B family member 19-like n=1 Tax=Cryptomeria japonica TaxID=3369 RepID=UPI0027DAB26B|nr:ABC transporter B family member 19-like [Cryptomeria japonica]